MESRSTVEVSELQIDRRRLVADHAYRSENITQHLLSTLAVEATFRQLAIASAEDPRHAAFAQYSETAMAAEQQAPRLIAESRRAIFPCDTLRLQSYPAALANMRQSLNNATMVCCQQVRQTPGSSLNCSTPRGMRRRRAKLGSPMSG